MFRKMRAVIVALVILAGGFASQANAQTTISTVTTPIEGSLFWANASIVSQYNKVIQDSCGEIYGFSDAGYTSMYPTAWSMDPGTGIQLTNYGGRWISGLMGGIALDSSNNLYVSDVNDHQIMKIPGTGSCGPQATPTSTTALFTMADLGLTGNYYPGDITIDASGNIFAYFSNGSIYELTAAGSYTQVASSVSGTVTQLAVDAAGALYYATGGSTVYKIDSPSTSSAAYAVVTGLNSVYGLTFSKSGNLYLEDTNNDTEASWPEPYTTIYEVPYVNGTLQYGTVYPAGTSLTGYLDLTTGADGKTLIYVDDAWEYYGFIPGVVNMGSEAIGSTSTAQMLLSFNSSVTPASIAIYGPGGVFSLPTPLSYPWWMPAAMPSCTAGTTYDSGSHCTVSVQFAPTTVGTANGSVVLLDASGNQLATAALTGIGNASALTVDPGTVSALGSGYTKPSGAMMDNSGNLFIADSSANTVWEIASGGSTAVALATGLNAPAGVAVDGAGNVYVANSGNNSIVEIPVVNGTLSASAQTTLISSSTSLVGTALSAPSGIAVDASGNIYIADTGNGRLLYIPYIGSIDPALAQAFTANLTSPDAVAVDASGNVFVADASSGKVYEFTVATGTSSATTVGSGYNTPTALAVDSSNSLVVVDSGNAKVWRIPNISGTLTPSSAVNVASQVGSSGTSVITAPYGVAIDATGNLYVTDATNAAVYQIARTSSSQSAGTVSAGSTSATMTYAVESAGTAPLILSDPYYTAVGNTTEFSLLSSDANSCTSGASIAVGGFCFVDAQYTPDSSAPGSKTETLTLMSNASNASSISLTFSGDTPVTATIPTTTAIAMTSPATSPVTYGVPVTYQVTVSATDTPTGMVDLYVDGSELQTATLSNGTATFALPAGTLIVGTHSVVAKYEGSATDESSSSSAVSLVVTSASTTTSLNFSTGYITPNSQPAGTALTLTVSVASSVGIQPVNESVTFIIADSAYGTTTQVVALSSSGSATYSYTPTAPSTSGTYDTVTISATYAGDTNFAGSSSSSSTIYVTGSAGLALATSSGTTLTSSKSSQSSITFTNTSYGGWGGTVSYSCDQQTLPANARCVFSPSSVSVLPSTNSSSQTAPAVMLKVTIDNASTSAAGFSPLFGGLAALMLFVMRRRLKDALSRSVTILCVVLGLACTMGLTSCGGTAKTYTTPTGNSTVTVYAAADPYESGSTSAVQACSSSSAPCSVQVIKVALTVQ